ncbi:MAG: patatin-like phospholipase family protein, partial [Vulcanimicrobiaceae bacterium]
RDAVLALARLRPSARAFRLLGLCDGERLRALLAQRLAFERLECSLIVSATNLGRTTCDAFYAFVGAAREREPAFVAHEPNAWPLRADNYVDAVRASFAVPPAFEPVAIACAPGYLGLYSDGALANNSPIRQAIDAGADAVTVIFVQHSGLRANEAQVKSLAHLSGLAFDVINERILDLDLKLARAINEAVRSGHAPGRRFVDIRVIGPSVPLRLPSLAFGDQAALDRVFAQGEADGRAALAAVP